MGGRSNLDGGTLNLDGGTRPPVPLQFKYCLPACYCSDRICITWGPWYFGDFRNIFLPNIGEDQINVLSSERKALGTVPYGKSSPGYCIMFKKG